MKKITGKMAVTVRDGGEYFFEGEIQHQYSDNWFEIKDSNAVWSFPISNITCVKIKVEEKVEERKEVEVEQEG